ncbi:MULTISPECIES: peptidylprolyl isomerase [Nocardia]|uniref:peptidylprolyl isomerase n=1 Tax=Nocardia TaxID=1817 RepID=UPI001E33845B|nr:MULTISPECIES: peptidylprolyl isomerase [Nocardia]
MSIGTRARAGAEKRRGTPMRRMLPGLGLLIAGAALTLHAAGGVAAQPWQAHRSPAGCAPASADAPNGKQWPFEPWQTIDPAAGYTASLETNCGTVTVALDAARAPRTVNSFVFLSDQQYFDHTRCHRLTTQGIFVLQCGDPTALGTGGPGYRFPDENLAGATYPAGTLAMANAGPGTNGSQFFLVYRDSQLPPNYTPFGRVVDGLGVLTGIAAAGVRDGSGDGAPTDDVVLNAVRVARG